MLISSNASSNVMRKVQALLTLLTILGMLGVGVAEGKKKREAIPPPDLPGKVSYYAWQLRGVPLDESEPITSQVQKLVVDHLDEWIANRTPTDVEVRRELESVLSKLRYPTYARIACFAEPWKGAVLIGAGYTLGWTDFNRMNVVALFESRNDKTRRVALTNFAPYTDLHYEFLPALGSDDFWFLICGFRLGKSQLRLSATLYSFDGQSLKSLWETRDVYDGKIDVSGDKVIIRYLKEDEYVRELAHGRKPPRHEAIYKVSSRGLQLESDREIPF